jgi:hypothetical protein
MKPFIVFLFIAAGAAMAQDQAPAPKPSAKKTSAAKAAAKPAAPVAQPLTIPKDAVSNPDGTYTWADKAGKQWTFTKTPFGISRTEAAGAAAAAPQQQSAIKSTDRGDTVLFEKPSPFGVTKWEKKKSEMTDEERSLFQNQHPDKQQ